MSKIFGIGTRKRCTAVLEEQARKAINESALPLLKDLNEAPEHIDKIESYEDAEFMEAYNAIVYSKGYIDAASAQLANAKTAMENQDYETAKSYIANAINELTQQLP